MIIAIGCDHAGYPLKEAVKEKLIAEGHEVLDVGTNSTESVDYPIYGKAVGEAVASGKAERGVAICGSGIGISIACNKVKGIRCCACSDCYSAKMSRAHNDANMLALGARVVGTELGRMIAQTFLTSEFEGGRHQRRIDQIAAIENGEDLG